MVLHQPAQAVPQIRRFFQGQDTKV